MKKLNLQAGVVLPSLMISTILVFAVVLIISQTAVDNYKTVLGEQHRVNAQLAADSAVDYAITQLNQDETWAGTSELDLFDNSEIRTTYEVAVTNLPNDNKQIDVRGRTYSPASAGTASATKSVTVELYSVSGGGAGGASIVTGVGGLILENNSKIVNGDVFVNGDITMSNLSQIGTTTSNVLVRAAHQSCPNPANATYPTVCALSENGQPITINNSARIYGDVQATNQTNGAGMTNPGLVAGTPAPQPLPIHDRAVQIAAATNNMTAAAASCSTNNGTRNIPANTVITGNVDWSRNCTITLNGDVYITGNVTMTQSAQVIVTESMGSDMPNMMIDGNSGLNMGNSSALTANSFGAGVQVITYRSAASCSPGCSDVTGVDLYNSRNIATITLDNSANAPESIFYAKWSQVNIINAGDIGALVGQTVRLRNSATVTFGASISGLGASPPTWLVYSYRQS